ncbi:MAG: hypothetical protein EBZ59_09740, partial [Planctomycetia bacterium]|nr:hypothetical protein [Planctomycetia bacterium]
MREDDDTFISSRLDDLDAPPAFRGSVDRVQGEVVEGWCISCMQPQLPVELDVFLGACRIGSVTTSEERNDVSKALAFPVKSGFRFSMQNCLRSAVGEALEILSRATPADYPTLLTLRVAGSDSRLPCSHGFRLAPEDVDRFSIVLQGKGARAFANRWIATRDALMADMPPPKPES